MKCPTVSAVGTDNDGAADQPLSALLDALVDGRGRVAPAEDLGVNYRTVTRCQQSRQMRQVLLEFRDLLHVGDDGPGSVGGDGGGEDTGKTRKWRVAVLERENRKLREIRDSGDAAEVGELDEAVVQAGNGEDGAESQKEPLGRRTGSVGSWWRARPNN